MVVIIKLRDAYYHSSEYHHLKPKVQCSDELCRSHNHHSTWWRLSHSEHHNFNAVNTFYYICTVNITNSIVFRNIFHDISTISEVYTLLDMTISCLVHWQRKKYQITMKKTSLKLKQALHSREGWARGALTPNFHSHSIYIMIMIFLHVSWSPFPLNLIA